MTAAQGVRIVAPGAGDVFTLGADRFRRKGPAAGPDDGFSVIEYEGAPGIPGPPPHRHRSFEEAWYVLDGEVEFRSVGPPRKVTSGTYVQVPRGVPHTFRVLGDRPARWIGIFSPGRYVRLVEELGAILPIDGPPDPRAIAELFARYDTELVR